MRLRLRLYPPGFIHYRVYELLLREAAAATVTSSSHADTTATVVAATTVALASKFRRPWRPHRSPEVAVTVAACNRHTLATAPGAYASSALTLLWTYYGSTQTDTPSAGLPETNWTRATPAFSLSSPPGGFSNLYAVLTFFHGSTTASFASICSPASRVHKLYVLEVNPASAVVAA